MKLLKIITAISIVASLLVCINLSLLWYHGNTQTVLFLIAAVSSFIQIVTLSVLLSTKGFFYNVDQLENLIIEYKIENKKAFLISESIKKGLLPGRSVTLSAVPEYDWYGCTTKIPVAITKYTYEYESEIDTLRVNGIRVYTDGIWAEELGIDS